MSTSLNHWNMQEHKIFAVMFYRYYRHRDLTYYIILYYIILYYIILYYIILYYIILYYIVFKVDCTVDEAIARMDE